MRWTRALWVWWVVLTALGLGLIVAGFLNSSLYRLKEREADITPKVQQLRDAFAPLRQRVLDVPLAILNDFEGGKLSLERLNGQRLVGQPFVHLWVLDAAGKSAFPDDKEAPPPAWVVQLVHDVKTEGTGLAPLRPMPGIVRPGRPASYLVWVAHDDHGRSLVSQCDLDFIFGPWLKGQVDALKLGDGVAFRVLSHEETWKRRHHGWRVHVSGKSRILRGHPVNSAWEFYLPTFFPDDARPFQQILVEVDGYAELTQVTRSYALILGAFALVMLSFALSLFLAARNVKRELALADARSNFTAMVSHELKTPVAAIRMYGEILVNKLVDDPAKVEEYHHTIMDEAARLQRLIENLLDLGKIERGNRTYALSPQPLNALVEEAIAQSITGIPPGYTLARDLAPDLPPVQADPDAARQAIANLVSNALKYGGKPADVAVTTRREGAHVLVEVSDRGPGIPENRRKAIFEPYVRLEDEARRESQGTGLGLALVKGYMEGQGGSAKVEPRAGGGSTFSLKFNA
ncbi:MAG: phoR 3 [Cyanobacteria bacterium RYN_339]|nr:phoR 3 [Cyanobacteria bacterium RYN_339]